MPVRLDCKTLSKNEAMVLDWFFKDSSQGNKQITPEESRRIVARFKEWSPRILTIPEVLSVMTFDAAIKYFETDRPPNPNIKKGAIIRQTHHKGQLLAQVFLDGNNELVLRPDGTPYGRQLVARNLDKKLRDTFGNKELIIVDLKDQQLGVEEFHRSIADQYQQWLRDLLRLPEVVPVMTYEAAIQYFVTDRPSDPRVEKGAILRQPHSQGYHLAQVFLDSNNNLVRRSDGKPYGRQLVAKKLDEELLDTFGPKNLIVVE